MLYLKQSTASQSVLLGPFVDSTDGATAETALSIANTDIRLSANGGSMFAKTSGGGTHDENGWYTITLDATDTATVGRLQISCKVAGALAVFMECHVLEEAIFDALFGASATGLLPANVTQISGDSTAADNAESFFDGTGYAGTNNVIPTVTDVTNLHASAATAAALATVDGNVDANKVILDALTAAAAAKLALSAAGIIGGTAATGTLSTTVMTSDLSGYVDDELIGRAIIWTGGTANGQASTITDYASTGGTVTYNAITTAPLNGDTFVIV